jgi:signal transduction histidine kinase
MAIWKSYRAQLQLIFLVLGLAAVSLTAWEAWQISTAALETATQERLRGIGQARGRQLERYFQNLGAHVLALSSDESVLEAIGEFERAWGSFGVRANLPGLEDYYRRFGNNVETWFPQDREAQELQTAFLLQNPHPVGAKDRMLEGPGAYGRVHARFHPTFHRYQTAFGLYDIFLIQQSSGRVLYSVFKEVDLGARLDRPGARESALGVAFRDAMALSEPEQFVLRDYEIYAPSHGQPAAFIAAPVWRAGEKVGVLAMQVSIGEVNRVMTADRNWEAEGLGKTGHTYVLGRDGKLRTDLRQRLERQDGGTGVLMQSAPSGEGKLRTEHAVQAPGLDWRVIAEIDRQEAFAPVAEMRARLARVGAISLGAFLIVAAWVGRSVTRPVKALAEGALRLGQRDFDFRFPVTRSDELGDLARALNKTVEELQRTTVSKEDLEKLAGQLITSQEDERKRIARELHDDLSQRLAALSIETGLLAKRHSLDAASRERVEKLQSQVAALSNDLHNISRRLHPAMLDDLGLHTAIEAEARAFFERGGPPVEVDASPLPLSADAKLAIYRIVQESLRNVEKYAEAESVHIQLRQEDNMGTLRIWDDGRGFDRYDPAWRRGLGLASMEERVRLLRGTLTITSSPGRGTAIDVRFPMNC